MAAGLGFKTFATGDVLSAADVNGYLMQGVLVFASAAARDAAITSPQEGQFAYLKDTNVTTYYTGSAWANLDTTGMTNPMTTTGDTIYSSSGSTPARLAIGSTGNVLTVSGGVPTWAAPAGGGGMTLISTATPSAATTVSFTSIPTTYKMLLVKFVARQSTTSDRFSVQVNGQTGSIYNWTAATITGTNTTVTNGSTGSTSFGNSNTAGVIPYCSTGDDSDQAQGEFYIYDANLAQARHQISWQSSGGGTRTLVAGQGYVDLPSSVAISQIDFIRGGSQTITGTFYLYGWS